jgi:hypothetical protein
MLMALDGMAKAGANEDRQEASDRTA